MAFVEKGARESCVRRSLPPQPLAMNKATGIALAALALALGAPAISSSLSAPVAVPLSRQVPDAVDAPYPRTEAFRTSPEYAALCRTVSEALVEAMSQDHSAQEDSEREAVA